MHFKIAYARISVFRHLSKLLVVVPSKDRATGSVGNITSKIASTGASASQKSRNGAGALSVTFLNADAGVRKVASAS